MIKKVILSPVDQYDMRASLQVSVLEALMKYRRWMPGELIFQGGTSLSLVHRSPRFSEDLDFLVLDDLNLSDVNNSIEQRLEKSMLKMHPLLDRITVSKARDKSNLRNLMISLSGVNLIGSVKVKVQMWGANAHVMHNTQAVISPVWAEQVGTNHARTGRFFVPTSTPGEIYIDKIKAIVDRPYLKGRDVFDLYWLTEQQNQTKYILPDENNIEKGLCIRLEAYPDMCAKEWLEKARIRIEELGRKETMRNIQAELKKWLPSQWLLDDKAIHDMAACAKTCVGKGMIAMQSIVGDSPRQNHMAPRG